LNEKLNSRKFWIAVGADLFLVVLYMLGDISGVIAAQGVSAVTLAYLGIQGAIDWKRNAKPSN